MPEGSKKITFVEADDQQDFEPDHEAEDQQEEDNGQEAVDHHDVDVSNMTVEAIVKACDHLRDIAERDQEKANSMAQKGKDSSIQTAIMREQGKTEDEIKTERNARRAEQHRKNVARRAEESKARETAKAVEQPIKVEAVPVVLRTEIELRTTNAEPTEDPVIIHEVEDIIESTAADYQTEVDRKFDDIVQNILAESDGEETSSHSEVTDEVLITDPEPIYSEAENLRDSDSEVGVVAPDDLQIEFETSTEESVKEVVATELNVSFGESTNFEPVLVDHEADLFEYLEKAFNVDEDLEGSEASATEVEIVIPAHEFDQVSESFVDWLEEVIQQTEAFEHSQVDEDRSSTNELKGYELLLQVKDIIESDQEEVIDVITQLKDWIAEVISREENHELRIKLNQEQLGQLIEILDKLGIEQSTQALLDFIDEHGFVKLLKLLEHLTNQVSDDPVKSSGSQVVRYISGFSGRYLGLLALNQTQTYKSIRLAS